MINLLICLSIISIIGFGIAIYLAAKSGGMPDIEDIEDTQ